MPSLTELAGIPFYSAYTARTQQNQAQGLQDLQEAGAVLGLKEKLLAQRRDAEMRQLLQQSGGNVEKALAAAIQSGNLVGAHQLAPIIESQRKANTTRVMTAGSQLLGPNNEVLHTVPSRPEATPEIIRLQTFLQQNGDRIPPEARAQIEARIKAMTERGPQTVINMPGSSDTVQGADGRFYKFRVGKDGQVEAVPMQTAGGMPLRPPETTAERNDRVTKESADVTLKSMRDRIVSMKDKLQNNSYLVGPAGIARRAAETVGGIVKPEMETPAIDYKNELHLLLADARKFVEQDKTISNEERRNLYETLGSGTFQTPASAIRALTNVLDFVESKRMTGPSRQAGIETAVRGAGWAFEPNKYDYRVVNGQVQRKLKE